MSQPLQRSFQNGLNKVSGSEADVIKRPLHLLYYPPYHSKYNPIERCWGILELKWNGAKLLDVETMLGWAKKMTWKGLHPVVELSRQVYTKGIALGKVAMEAVEARLKRDPQLPKYDIVIKPTVCLNVTSLVVSSCVYNWGQIEQRVAH